MGTTTALHHEIKRTFFPFMEAKGFTLDQRYAPHFIDFRRTLEERVQFFEIQWEKYGKPRFVVNFTHVSAKGTICYAEHVPASDVGPGQAPFYCRLHPNGSGSSTRHWFRQDRTILSALLSRSRLYPPDLPVRQLIELFPEVEHYWQSGVVGPNSRLISCPWAQDVV